MVGGWGGEGRGRTEALHFGRMRVCIVGCGDREGIEMVLGEPARRRWFGVGCDDKVDAMRCDALDVR